MTSLNNSHRVFNKNQKLISGFILIIILISLNLWSFQSIPENIYRILEAIILAGLFIIVLYKNSIFKANLIFKNNVLFFMLIPLISGIAALIFHNQNYSLSLLIIRMNFLWLFYFALHIFNVPKERIITLIIFVGLVWGFLTIVQQFTYPRYYFFSRKDTDTYSILRSGVYRFMIWGHQYGTFVLLFFFHKYLITRKLNYLAMVVFGLAALYYYGTRQFALSAAVCMCIALLIVKGKGKLTAIAFLLIGGTAIFFLKEILFGQYIQMTNEQLEYGDDIRQLSADFWLNEYWPHWVTKIIGNGTPHSLSDYGREMDGIIEYFHFYRSDVGIIGAFNEFGILYVINILWVNFIALRRKYISYSDKYLKLLFYNSLILLVTSEYYSHQIGIPFYCLIFYLVDKSYQEKKEAIVLKPRNKHAFNEDPSYHN